MSESLTHIRLSEVVPILERLSSKDITFEDLGRIRTSDHVLDQIALTLRPLEPVDDANTLPLPLISFEGRMHAITSMDSEHITLRSVDSGGETRYRHADEKGNHRDRCVADQILVDVLATIGMTAEIFNARHARKRSQFDLGHPVPKKVRLVKIDESIQEEDWECIARNPFLKLNATEQEIIDFLRVHGTKAVKRRSIPFDDTYNKIGQLNQKLRGAGLLYGVRTVPRKGRGDDPKVKLFRLRF